MQVIYLTLMQFFFPTLSLGNIIGAGKIGGVAQGAGAMPAFWQDIDWKFIIKNIPFFLVGSFIGASIISEISQFWILPLLIVAFFVAEFAPKIAKFFTRKVFFILEGLLGIYVGLLGASIKPTLLSILRLQVPEDEKIMFLKIQIQTMMFFASFAAAIAHFFHGTLLLWVIVPLALGNIVGGFIGGKILHKTGKLSGKIQKNVMRASFAIGILSSIWMIYFS